MVAVKSDNSLNAWADSLRLLAADLVFAVQATAGAPKGLLVPEPDLQHGLLRPLGLVGRETPYTYEEIARALHFIADMCEV
jgi:hypothetical protein